tara:strand:- start:51 stop:824 length:774 start_codon:yes stop_codon:yes gene_type:complete
MSNYRIAIPSLNRSKGLGEKTLKVLNQHGIPSEVVDIFVANDDQAQLYRKEYPDYNIVVGIIGKRAISNFIFQDYYSEGQHIVHFDDDIEQIRFKNPRNWEDPNTFCDDELDLKKEINIAFRECEKSGRHLWGVYPVSNPYFMKNTISYDYKFVGGWMFGVINKKSSNECLIGDGCIDDYERSIRHYLSDGGVVRLNYICCKTNYGNPDGGIGSIEGRGRQESFDQLEESFAGLFTIRVKKGSKCSIGDPILKDKRS